MNTSQNITTSRTFIPSVNREERVRPEIRSFEQILRTNRWIMLLGAPGSGKTSLLRWLTLQYACSALEGFKSVYLNDVELQPVRIPLLIRLGEFAEWLTKNSAATLFDYIGYQTWLGERYMFEGYEEDLKCAVLQGHALILLDGLDGVATFEHQTRIRHLVIEFISKHVRSNSQVSAFDDTLLVQTEDKYVGEVDKANQIIITSRLMEYFLHPWESGAIEHYSLSTLTKIESIHFINHWISQVESKVIQRTNTIGITFEKCQRRADFFCSGVLEVLQKLLDENNDNSPELTLNERRWNKHYHFEHVLSIPMVLSLLCSVILKEGSLPNQKAALYHACIHSIVPVWISSCGVSSILSENVLTQILSQVAYYLHKKSPSGLIDEFDLRRFCYVSLKMIYTDHTVTVPTRLFLEPQVEAFMQLLKSDVGIATVSSLAVYGFVHLIFQEYFVALALMKPFREIGDYSDVSTSISKLAVQLVQHTVVPRFREPLILAISLISSQFSSINFDLLCYELIALKKSSIPFGALLLLEALNNLITLPSKDILFKAFHSILILDCSTVFDSILRRTLLNVLLAKNWLADYLSCESNIEPFCKLVLRLFEISKGYDDLSEDTVWGEETKLSLPKWITPAFTQQLHELLYTFPNTEYIVDQTLRRISLLQDGSICMCKNSLQHYLLERKVAIWRLHPTVVTLIIAVYGGLFRYRGIDELWVKFSPQCMYRDSILSPMLIDYLNQDSNNGHMEKIQQLITACEQRLKIISFSDVTMDAVDLIIALICLRGLEKPSEFLTYSSYAAFPVAIRIFKRILFYLRQTFVCVKGEATSFSKIMRAVMTDFCDLRKRSDKDVGEFLEATIIGYVRLTETAKPIILRKLRWPRVKPAFAMLPLKLDSIELADFLSRAPSVLRLLCSNQCDSLYISSFDEMLKTVFNKAQFSALFAFVPRSLQPLYERLISNDLLKSHDVDESSSDFMNANDRKVPFAFFLYQVLRYLETRINFHLVFLVLPLLEPFLTNHGLTSYMIALLADLKKDKSFDFKCHTRYAELSTPDRVQATIDEERRQIECMVKVRNQECHDEQLITSAICLMRLCRNFRANEVFDDICRAVFAIQTVSLRALAVTAIWHLTYQSQLKIVLRNTLLSAMSLCFESLPADVPLLTITLILVHSVSMKHAFSRLFELQRNAVLQALNEYSLPTEDIRAIYRALSRNLADAFVPSNTVVDCQTRTSMAIARCFTDDKLWSSNRHSGKTLLFSALYLIELAVDVQILRSYFEPRAFKVHSSSPERFSNVTVTYSEALTLIDQYQKSNSDLATADDTQLQTISLQLYRGDYTIIEAQQLVKQLRHHFRLFLFVQRDCLSLAGKDVFAPLIIEVLCASLESPDDQVREQLHYLFARPLLLPFNLDNLHILMNNASYYIEKSSLHYACMLYNRIKISRLEDLHVLLQLEYDRIHIQGITSCSNSRLSFLRFIGQCEKDVLNYFIQHIHSLTLTSGNSTNTETIHFEYVTTLIRHGVQFVVRRRPNLLESTTLFSDDTTYRQFLIDLLKTCRVSVVQEAVAQVLAEVIRPVSVMPNNEFKKQIMIVHEVFWQIVATAATDEQPDEHTINVLIICLCSLCYRYVQQPAPLYTPDKSTETILIKLHRNHKSRDVQNRAHCLLSLYYLTIYGEEDLLQRCDMDAEVAYRLLMYSLQDQCGHFFHRPNVERKVGSLICAHPEKLFSLFVNDFKCYMTSNENLTFQENYPPHTRIAAELIRSSSLKNYCEAVRTSDLGELGFLQVLRSASKNWTPYCQTEVLIIAAAFGDLTWYLVDFVLEVALRLSGVDTSQDFVALINEVSERDVIDYVVTNLRASSMIQRYLMGEILVHLALKDIVSPFEITNELLDTINDTTSQRILRRQSFGPDVTLSEEMARLLKRLICIVPPITPTREFSHFISQQDIDHDFAVALNAFDKAFCSLANETDNNN